MGRRLLGRENLGEGLPLYLVEYPPTCQPWGGGLVFISLRDFVPGSLSLPVPTLGRPPVERFPFVATGTHAVAYSSPKGGLSGAWLTSCPVIMFWNLG